MAFYCSCQLLADALSSWILKLDCLDNAVKSYYNREETAFGTPDARVALVAAFYADDIYEAQWPARCLLWAIPW